jgi:hypothetical protein
MRALIGAIIAAGSLIGLGLATLGIGLRYQNLNVNRPGTDRLYDLKFYEMDNPLQFGMVFLSVAALIGLGIAFLGLMYHHERRYREGHLGEADTRAVP